MSAPFFWLELHTRDLDGATAFYREVLGWTSTDFQGDGPRYAVFSVGDRGVAGATSIPTDSSFPGSQTGWLGYIDSSNVDGDAARIAALGGRVDQPPYDIPGIGRCTKVADPQGAAFFIMNPIPPAAPPPELAPGTPGTVGWWELHAVDGPAAFDFYGSMFGWTKAEAFDMGAMGVYQLFTMGAVPVGGIMTGSAGIPGPRWLFYFHVAEIEGAAERVRRHGGQVLNGPHTVPSGARVLEALDPQGGHFALTAAGG